MPERMLFNVQPQPDGFYCVWMPGEFADERISIRLRAGDRDEMSTFHATLPGRAFVPAADPRAQYELQLVVGDATDPRATSAAVKCRLRRGSLAERFLPPRRLPHSRILRFSSFPQFARFAARAGGIATLRGNPVESIDPAMPNGLYRTADRVSMLNRAVGHTLLAHATHAPQLTRRCARELLGLRGAATVAVEEDNERAAADYLPREAQDMNAAARVLRVKCGAGLSSRVVALRSPAPSGQVAIFHEGHTGSSTALGWPIVSWLLERGWDVYCMDMALCGRNRVDARSDLAQHNDLMRVLGGIGTAAIALMVEPVLAVLDHIARSSAAGTRLAICGRSGGGLLAYISAALDERVDACVAIAAGTPLSQRLEHSAGDLGDYEQFAPEFYDYVRHEDLMLCAGQKGLLLIYNSRDPDCFALPPRHPLQDYLHAEARRLDCRVRVFIDESHAAHSVGPAGFAEIESFLAARSPATGRSS